MWLLLDDGQFTLQVDRIKGNQIHCIILSGGLLSNNKVINRDGVGLSAYTLSLKDKEDLKNAVLFTYWEPIDWTGVTNTLKVVEVDEMTQAATTKAE